MTIQAAALLITLVASGAELEADYVIRNAQIHDGSGAEARVGSVAIKGQQIVAVGALQSTRDARVIDGTGLIVAPGFIDLHNHSDSSITKPQTRQNANYLMQGVTTIVTGNCGGGRVDVAAYLQEIEQNGAGTNVVHLIPHGRLRSKVMRQASRPSSPKELEAMKQEVQQAMLDGAWGMSTGLIYVPGSFATTDELVELSKVVAAQGGIYVSHMRNEGTRLLQSIQETLEIGRRAGLPVHISHFKASGQAAWGLAADAVAMIQQARRQGQLVTADQYPYVASSTSLAAMVIPDKYRSGDKLAEALDDERDGPKVLEEIQLAIRKRGNGERLFVASYKKNRQWQGKNLTTLAQKEGKSVLEIALHIQRHGGAQMVNFGMSEEEVRLIMQQDFVATASDGSAKQLTDNTVPHPRSYGCFPRKIGYYSIEGNVLPLSQAIRSATGLPADILGLPRRGYLKPGYLADVVVVDPNSFRDRATFQKPHQYAEGVRYLFVNGILAVDEGKLTDALAGQPLRKRRVKGEE